MPGGRVRGKETIERRRATQGAWGVERVRVSGEKIEVGGDYRRGRGRWIGRFGTERPGGPSHGRMNMSAHGLTRTRRFPSRGARHFDRPPPRFPTGMAHVMPWFKDIQGLARRFLHPRLFLFVTKRSQF